MTADVAKACTAETGFLVVAAPTPRRRRRRRRPRRRLRRPVRRAAGCGGGHAGRPECGRPRWARRAVLGRLARRAGGWHTSCVDRLVPAHQLNEGCSGMRIAQVAPLIESVPPSGYGGTERVVSYLTEELVREGHEVTLFASGDSQTSAELVACSPRSLRTDESVIDPIAHQVVQLEAVAAADRPLRRHPLARGLLPLPDVAAPRRPERDHAPRPARHPGPRPGLRRVRRHAGRLDLRRPAPAAAAGELGGDRPPRPAAGRARARTPSAASTSRSSAASRPRSGPTGRSRSRAAPGCRSGSPPRSTTWTASTSRRRSSRSSTPTTWSSSARSGPSEKDEFLGHARALLFPIDWSEPFGLVMIESMACGTPVIAYRSGSVPEVIDEGVIGLRRRRHRGGRRRRSHGSTSSTGAPCGRPSSAASASSGWPATTSTSTSA